MSRYAVLSILSALFLLTLTAVQPARAMPKAGQALSGPTGSGTVVETMNAAGYTYVLVATDGSESWIAVPETQVTEGSTIQYYQGMVMQNFVSKTLDRTFESIIFSPGLADGSEPAGPAAEGDSFAAAIAKENSGAVRPATAPPPQVSGGSVGAVVPFSDISVEKATGSDGYNVEEIFSKAGELNGSKVQVRGKVVKFSPMIMGKNWIHIQDGSGEPMKNTHDLVITTAETAEVGQIAVFEGTLTAQKDFGAGYKYDAIVEQATILK
jgi:hypothetical protein